MTSSQRACALTLARLLCGFTFLVASIDKLGEPSLFAEAIENYHILPHLGIPLAAVVVPWLEFFTGLGLILGWHWRSAAFVYCGLLAMYSFALAFNLLRGVEMSCGCFSLAHASPATWLTVLRDLVLLIPGLFVLAAPETLFALTPEKLTSRVPPAARKKRK